VTPRPRVLVVDDDGSIRQFLQLALTGRGYEVVSAEHGKAALEAIHVAPPGLVLLDMRMPVMDGWAFAAAYRELPPPRAPVVVLTAARDAAEYAEQIQADDYLAKPFSLRDLFRTVSRFVGEGVKAP
jgi:two-component system chemotaxis response regulator CheY